MQAAFSSQTNYQLVEEQISYRYPTNKMELKPENLVIVFRGDPPSQQTLDLLQDMGADLSEGDED